ncbi:hypothetical protein VP03_12445 [Sinorhizobium meliloti]|uniref:hypothetical protein n=1 Tax=Rhizobium meliloti TaxID=382 RepID=UPI000614796E|nr:hypothetical protein [Sinorhizobium meliloti]KKA13741.1 hypothetical protein VP03_12445 [Sinorhizobium meliloti]
MPNKPVLAAAEGLPDRNAAIAKAMLRLEAQINELASMSQIMADLLTDVLTGSEPDEHGYMRMLVSKEDMDNMAFAWCNVSSRAIGLKKAFYAAGKEGEGK